MPLWQPTRRQFLRNAAIGLGVLSCQRVLAQPFEKARYIGVETELSGNVSRIFALSETGNVLHRLPVGFRAHGLTETDRFIVIFPRRPGNKFAIVDKTNFEIRATVSAPSNRHFFGHGAVSFDGKHLLTTENDLDHIRGVIGVYDISTAQRIDEVRLPGSGPHEIIRHTSRDLFFIAVGGLETHPDYGRTPFNITGFQSQIVLLDLNKRSIDPLGFWTGTEGISLRHLAMDQKGRLYIGGQVYDRARATGKGLAWLLDGEDLCEIEISDELGGYVSSVAAGESHAMMSSKQTGKVLWIDGKTAVRRAEVESASALAFADTGPVYAGARRLHFGLHEKEAETGFEYDNHGLSLSV